MGKSFAIASDAALSQLLAAGCQELGLSLAPAQLDQMLAYLDLLRKWGRTYNLTNILEPRQMVVQHLLDSLSVVPFVPPGRLLDVGAGAGLPGLPLAMALPDLQVTLLDSVSRKTRFMQQVCLELGIKNAQVITARVETCEVQAPFDGVICRAFASLQEIVAKVQGLCKKEGRIIAMKGRFPGEELEAMEAAGLFFEIHPLQVPGLEAQRHVVVIRSQ